jgi:hypothetical protein
MSTLSYLVGVAEGLGYKADTAEQQNRGISIIPAAFAPVKVYGDRQRVTVWRVVASLVGSSVGDGTCFDALEALTDGFEADQTADGSAGSVDVGQWDTETVEKGYITFATLISVKE